MGNKLDELSEELKTVLSGSTIDAILPPLLFVVVNGIFGLDWAVFSAIALAVVLGLLRLLRKQPWHYAMGGLIGVGLAAGLAYLTRDAASYFIPAILGSGLFFVSAVISNLAGKPLAAWASHLTRGWPLAWFWREDIKPAYREVTWIWAGFFGLRLALQVYLFRLGEAARLAWTNTFLGWPVTIMILVISYLYGIWRLDKLKGPGVDEFQEGKAPPWQGQKRGF